MAAGDTDGVIGVWSTASRSKMERPRQERRPAQAPSASRPGLAPGQPARQRSPAPVEHKDKFKASEPEGRRRQRLRATSSSDPQYDSARQPAGCWPGPQRASSTAATRRRVASISTSRCSRASQPARWACRVRRIRRTPVAPSQADLLRLNTNVAPTTGTGSYSPLGAFGGDVAGFPNGRRVGDDVLDIDGKGRRRVGSCTFWARPTARRRCNVSDNVQENDTDYLNSSRTWARRTRATTTCTTTAATPSTWRPWAWACSACSWRPAVAGPRVIGVVRRRISR